MPALLDALLRSRQFTSLHALPLLLLLLSGCATVEGGLEPRHFQFVDVVPKRGKGAGGWRAACVHVGIRKTITNELFFCKFGVEMPIENDKQGFIPVERAQSVAAKCANLAASNILRLTTKETPLGIACELFKTEYDLVLSNTISGSHATRVCDVKAKPVVVTPP
ncbi:hypothetical protein [Archangium lipolyticum]|uniref:hypothetical protein n=1 Tax=Archangium lipolyticum TaxID=2970465 RepID=UPI00214A48E8|nr:hypothetical protein [Archangium lipolyticum]